MDNKVKRQEFLRYNVDGALHMLTSANRFDDLTRGEVRDCIGQALNHLTEFVEDVDNCKYEIKEVPNG